MRHSQFRPAVLDIAARFLGRPKDELDGEDVQQHRRFRAIARTVTIALTLLTLLLIVGITGLILQIRETERKTSQLLAAQSKIASEEGNYGRALRFAVLAARDTVLSPRSVEGELQLARSAHASTLVAQFTHKGIVNTAAFSPDGTKVVTAAHDQVCIWDVATGKERVRLRHEKSVMYVRSAVFSPDGTKVVTTSFDQTARIWDVATGNERVRLRHEAPVTSVVFTPDGTKVVTASEDRTARVWDVATGNERARLRHEGSVQSAAFSHEGTKVVTA
ncbi:MAG: hypothetical protein OEV01_17360, partial [Nitrospira sp.]|nr:hypothetical protein [Nitrospira sp.]